MPAGPQTYSLVFSATPVGNVNLLVSSLNVSISSTIPPVVSVVASVKNLGPDDAGPSVTRYYLSRNPVVDGTAVLLGQRSIPALPGNTTSTTTTPITVPSNLTSGTYYLIAVADADNAVTEYFEGDNVKAAKFTLTLP